MAFYILRYKRLTSYQWQTVLVDFNDIHLLSMNRGDGVVVGPGWAISYEMREIFVAALSSVVHEEVKYFDGKQCW